MFKCIDRVVGELIEAPTHWQLLEVMSERLKEYGDEVHLYQEIAVEGHTYLIERKK